MNGQDSQTEIFDVFLCHNSEDKPAVREIAEKLSKENIKPWMDEADIRTGSFWHAIIGQQIESVKSAAVFVGTSGVGPWQSREIIALLDEFDKRGCPVIPAILPSDPPKPIVLPWSLKGLHCVDFRTDSQPLERLIWGITGQKPVELVNVHESEKPATMGKASKPRLIAGRDGGALLVNILTEARFYPALVQAPDEEQSIQLNILRKKVTIYWVDGVLKRSLYNEVLLSLGSREVGNAVETPWKYTVEVADEMKLGPLDDRNVNTIYDATGLMLILGEPGAGKTTTLLGLARTLLDRARDDIKERIPVVLNLSSWKKQPLAEWIALELSEKYQVPKKIGRDWLKHGYLVPLLDGLDEVATVMQPDCVGAINSFIEEFNPQGLLVCCRLNEYRWLPERLKLNGAICLEPLSRTEVDEYLTSGGSKLAALHDAVNTDSILQELAQTPLMLSIMSLVSEGTGSNELAGQKADSIEERRKQIFRLYVEQMFQRKGKASLMIPKQKTLAWLTWLAGKMKSHSQSVFLIEGLQPSWLDKTAERLGYENVGGLIIGLLVGLIVGLSFGLSLGLGREPIRVLKFGLISGFYGALVGGLTGMIIPAFGVGLLKNIVLVETISWEWNQLWNEFWNGMIRGLIAELKVVKTGLLTGLEVLKTGPIGWLIGWLILGFIVRLGAWLIVALVVGLIVVLVVGLIGGLLSGLSAGFSGSVKADKTFPNQGIKLSLKNSLTIFLVIWLPLGAIGGLIGWLGGAGEITKEVPYFAVMVGLFFGLTTGLNRGGIAVVKHYALRLILWLSGNTPFNFIKFLDHCAKLILLKKVGGGYIFIHRMLLDYFADLPSIEKSDKSKKT